jgi:serine/threonine protein kinase
MVACPPRDNLRGYVVQDESLGPDQIEQIESHIEFCKLCQEVLEHLDEEDEIPGTTMPHLPGYRVYRHLGSGAFGEVWLAQDLNLPRVVAVKTLKMRAGNAEQVRALEALRKDAHLMTQVEHPNVVRVYAWLTVHDHHYLVMQYVSGGSLSEVLKHERSLDWQRAARYAADVGEGLLDVHARGIVHRDVKPANILWDPGKDEALLTDFGVGTHISDPAAVAGSIPYMAPEALDGCVSPSLDVYSLAATFFHLVTGSAPFPELRLASLKDQIRQGLPDSDPRCTGFPEPLERIIRVGLEADADRRPSLKEFVTQLRGILNQLLVDALTMRQRPLGPGPVPVPSTEVPPGAGSKPPTQPTTEPQPPKPGPVDLRLIISRQDGPSFFVPVATTHPHQPSGRVTRDMKKVPPPPDQVRLRTGDRVRVEVSANRPGYLTVFNVGPMGTLNLLYPDGDPHRASEPHPIEPNRPLHILDIEMTPPAGRERLFAVWTRQPLPLDVGHLWSVAHTAGPVSHASRPYHATRDIRLVQESVGAMGPDDWRSVTLELDHVEPVTIQGV